jgi:thiol-disulfide isomerase/thioredoxin
MKSSIYWLSLLITTSAFAQPGYEIKLTFKPYKNQYVYLGHYFGKSNPIIDSALLNAKGEAIFKGKEKLQGGVYLIGYPNKSGFFEMLVDKKQHFSVIADTATLKKGPKFIGSPVNTLFIQYKLYMDAKGAEVTAAKNKLKTTQNKADSVLITDQMKKIELDVFNYRENIIKKNPESLLTTLLVAMKEPVLTGRLKTPLNRTDSTDAYNYFKAHYWDGVNFWDGRLAYTNFLEDKVDRYLAQLVIPHPDSVNRELDKMLGPAVISKEMTKLLLVKFTNRYITQQYMYEDAIFVHLYEKYYAQKDYEWLTPQGRKMITERAYNLMSNIMGSFAEDIQLPDSTGKIKTLYSDTVSTHTMVVFWDPSCGHCKEVLPKLDSLYRTKWKAEGVHIFAIAKETDQTKKEWLAFINEQHLQDWTHVYYSKADDKARTDVNIAGYSQLYDVLSYPTLYLLDKEKRIIAKKLAYSDFDNVLDVRLKGK